jgi:hypothetical protein
VLHPVATWSGATDSLFGSPMDIAVSGCTVAVADFDTRSVSVKTGPEKWRMLGRQGAGPGEYQLPGRVTYLPSGVLVVYDLTLRRLVRIGADGKAVGPPAVLQVPYRHPIGGMILAVDDSTLADGWFGARIPGRPIPDSVLAGLPLVSRLGLDGLPRGGWGHAVVPPGGSAPVATRNANAAAMTIHGGRLVVLRRFTAVLEEYDLRSGELLRTDSLAPIDARVKYYENGEGMAGAIASLDGGQFAVILRKPLGGEGEAFPSERLVIVDSARRVIDSYELTTRGNRLAFAGGAYLFAVGAGDSTRTDEGDVVIDLLRLPGRDSTDGCGWVPAH